MTKSISISNFSEIKEIHKIACETKDEIEIKEGSNIVDAKSILGLMVINYKNPIFCTCINNDFFQKIEKFIKE